MTIAAEPLSATANADSAARRPGNTLLRRALTAPLWAHALALVVLLVATAPLLHVQSSFTSDEGAYAHQVHAIQHGHWAIDQATDRIDPTGRWFGIVNGSIGSNGRFAYTSHPLVVLVMARLASGLGDTVGLHLLPLAGVVGVAIAAWLLAGVLRPRARGRSLCAVAFWVAAMSPALVNGTVIWAHTVSAALAGFAVVGAAWLFERGVHPRALALLSLGVTAAGGVLIRSEGVLFAFALSAVLFAGLWLQRARVSAVLGAAALALPAGAAYVLERQWIASIVGGPSTIRPGVRQVTGSWVSGRLSGGWHDVFSPHARDVIAGLVGGTSLALVMFAAAKLRRLGAGRGGGPAPAGVVTGEIVGLLVAALVLLVARTMMRPTEAVTGLLAAWPFAIVGLALARWQSMTAVERMLVAASSVFAGAVLLTGYAEGGGQEWGGRFFSPLLVPLAVLAVVWIADHAAEWQPRDRAVLVPVLAAIAIIPSLLGLVVVARLRAATDRIVDEVTATKPAVVITDSEALPRVAWRVHGVSWLLVHSDEMQDAVSRTVSAGIGPVVVVESSGSDDGSLARGTTQVPAPHLAHAGYSLRLVGERA